MVIPTRILRKQKSNDQIVLWFLVVQDKYVCFMYKHVLILSFARNFSKYFVKIPSKVLTLYILVIHSYPQAWSVVCQYTNFIETSEIFQPNSFWMSGGLERVETPAAQHVTS